MREKIIDERIEAAWQKSRGEESYDPYYPVKASQNFIDGYMAGMAEKEHRTEVLHSDGLAVVYLKGMEKGRKVGIQRDQKILQDNE